MTLPQVQRIHDAGDHSRTKNADLASARPFCDSLPRIALLRAAPRSPWAGSGDSYYVVERSSPGKLPPMIHFIQPLTPIASFTTIMTLKVSPASTTSHQMADFHTNKLKTQRIGTIKTDQKPMPLRLWPAGHHHRARLPHQMGCSAEQGIDFGEFQPLGSLFVGPWGMGKLESCWPLRAPVAILEGWSSWLMGSGLWKNSEAKASAGSESRPSLPRSPTGRSTSGSIQQQLGEGQSRRNNSQLYPVDTGKTLHACLLSLSRKKPFPMP